MVHSVCIWQHMSSVNYAAELYMLLLIEQARHTSMAETCADQSGSSCYSSTQLWISMSNQYQALHLLISGPYTVHDNSSPIELLKDKTR